MFCTKLARVTWSGLRSVKLLLASFAVWFVAAVLMAADGKSEPANPATPRGSDRTADAKPASITLPEARVTALDGSAKKISSLVGTAGTVVVFTSNECPISNGYVPALNQMVEEFGPRGITIVAINPNAGQGLPSLRRHHTEYRCRYPEFQDPQGKLAAQLEATRCPEAFLFDSRGSLRYRGRIDDRYTVRGRGAREVRRQDLQLAIRDLLAGKAQDAGLITTEPVGCPILTVDREKRELANQDKNGPQVTYKRDIEPLLRKNCRQCHKPGGIGPFSLQTYEQAFSWADDIRTFTANRSMPPWKPVAGHGEFHNERRLTASEIERIAAWVEAGAPRGASVKATTEHVISQDEHPSGWRGGTPDLILSPSEDYSLKGDGPDIYRCFVLPTDFPEDRYVSAIEVRPGNNRVVHHVIAFLDSSGKSVSLDARDSGPGYSTSAGFPGFLPRGGLGGWAPGNLPHRLPDGMAKVLPKGAKVVMQVHYHPSGKPESDRTQLGLHFAKGPVTRTVRSVPLMPFGARWSGMRIPANDNHSEVTASLTLPRDVQAVTITPHMHLLGKDMKVTAYLPDGTRKPLLYITDWDFNWQESYQFRHPVPLPAGTRLDLVAHFDNSAANPRNPRNPPQDVRWGEQTTDEMCIAFLEVVPEHAAQSPQDLKLPHPARQLLELLRSRPWSRPAVRRESSSDKAAKR